MIETAWNYCQLVLASRFQNGMIEQTLATLSIEIVLKSFNSVVAANAGQLNEKYVFRLPPDRKATNKHNLVTLVDFLPADVRSYLIDPQDHDVIHEHQDTFSDSRYFYEPTSPDFSTDAPMKLAVKMICKTVLLYQTNGCTDPFIVSFNVHEVFFTHVQRIAFVPSAA